MKIRIAGARGQLGQTLQAHLRAHDVVALGHEQLDITRLAVVRDALAARRPDLVINAAAYNDVDGAESHHEDAFAGNALGPRNLAVVTAAWSIRLLHLSTDYVASGTFQAGHLMLIGYLAASAILYTLYAFYRRCPLCRMPLLLKPIRCLGMEFYLWTFTVPRTCRHCGKPIE